jgi:hypothetical protein
METDEYYTYGILVYLILESNPLSGSTSIALKKTWYIDIKEANGCATIIL